LSLDEQSGFGSGGAASAKEVARPSQTSFRGGEHPPLLENGQDTPAATQLQDSFLRRFFQLQASEARLAGIVSRKRAHQASTAVRQVELERERLGRELHTGVGQLLAAIHIQVDLIEELIPELPAGAGDALRRIDMLTAEALTQVRSLSRRLHPPEWQSLSLEAALTQLWDISGVSQRFSGDVCIQSPTPDPQQEVKILLYRAAQEALANIMRHSHANRVDLRLENRDEGVLLTVCDDGRGFDTSVVFNGGAELASGIGLRAIRAQAADLGGQLRVNSGPQGTTLAVFVPLPAS